MIKLKQFMAVIIFIIILVGLSTLVAYSRKNHLVQNQITNQDKDQEVINGFITHGSNPEKDHIIEFAFLGDWSNINKLKDVLLSQGYRQDASQTDEMLIMTKPHKLHLDEIKPETQKMEGLAKQYNVEFDGWSAVIVR